MEAIFGVVAGLIIGAAVVWAALRGRIGRLEGQIEQSKTGEELLEKAKEQLRESFEATASRVVANNSAQFLQLAEQNLSTTMAAAKGELEQRHQQFQELVKPLAENYNKLDPTSLMEQNVLSPRGRQT